MYCHEKPSTQVPVYACDFDYATPQALADPERRPSEQAIPADVLQHGEQKISLTVRQIADALRSSKRGVSNRFVGRDGRLVQCPTG